MPPENRSWSAESGEEVEPAEQVEHWISERHQHERAKASEPERGQNSSGARRIVVVGKFPYIPRVPDEQEEGEEREDTRHDGFGQHSRSIGRFGR